MRTLWLVGMGPGNPDFVSPAAAKVLAQADVLIGAERLLEELPEEACGNRHALTRTGDIIDLLNSLPTWENAAVALSGDTGMFSGAKLLAQRAPEEARCQVRHIPAVGSASYFASVLGMPWQDWKTVSAHGISCDVAAEVRANPKLFLVTGGANPVRDICQRLVDAGLGGIRVYVGENLSYPEETITQGSARQLAERDFCPLSVMLCVNDSAEETLNPATRWPWATAGIPDELFTRGKVPMTKQEVRAVALSKLRVAPGETLYDIGAGTGSVSVEMALLAGKTGRVYAIERNPEGCTLIAQNAADFGANNVLIVEGEAPAAMAGLPAPDAAFIGGSGSNMDEIVRDLLDANPRVRICVTCVTLETLATAMQLFASDSFTGFECCCVNVSRSHALGSYNLMKAENPIYIINAQGAGEPCCEGDAAHD